MEPLRGLIKMYVQSVFDFYEDT